jgi:hypothetical protein
VKLADVLVFLHCTASGTGCGAGTEITKLLVKLAGVLVFLQCTTSEAGLVHWCNTNILPGNLATTLILQLIINTVVVPGKDVYWLHNYHFSYLLVCQSSPLLFLPIPPRLNSASKHKQYVLGFFLPLPYPSISLHDAESS